MACLSQSYPSLSALQTVPTLIHPIKADFISIDSSTLSIGTLLSGFDSSCDVTCELETPTDKVYMSPAQQSSKTSFELKIDLTTTAPFSRNVKFKCTQGTTEVLTNQFSVSVECANYNNLKNTLVAGTNWDLNQTPSEGIDCYYQIQKSYLDSLTTQCPVKEIQVFVSQSDTVTTVSEWTGSSGTATDKFYDTSSLWYWDTMTASSSYRDEADYTFYIRVMLEGGYTQWLSSQVSLYCDPCHDQTPTCTNSDQTTGKTYIYDLNQGSSNVQTLVARDEYDYRFYRTWEPASTNGCDAIYYYHYTDSTLSTAWSDSDVVLTPADRIRPETLAGTITTQYIYVSTASGYKKTVYVKGANTGKNYSWFKAIFIVCGQETVVCNQATDYQNLNLQKYYVGGSVASSTLTISQSTYSAWFTATEGSNSDSSCLSSYSYNLCIDSACSSNYVDTSIIKIQSNDIVITLNPFNQVDLYLQVYYSKGKISAVRKMSIATCGLETVSMTNPDLEITYEYLQGTSVEGTNTTWIIYSSEFETNFISSNAANCPLHLFEIVDAITYDSSNVVTSTTPNSNSKLSVVSWGTNSNFNIYLETTASFNWTTYYLRASTQSTFDTVANSAYMKLNLQVIDCASQSISIIGSSLTMELTQYQSKTSISVVSLFNSSHSTFCPITSYSVSKVVDASTKKDVTSDVSTWIFFGTSPKESNFDYFGNLIVSQSKSLVTYNIYILASTGNTTISDHLVTLSINEQPNIAPYFMSDLEDIEIDLNDMSSYNYSLPTIVDLNPGQEVTVTVTSDAEFIQYDEVEKTIVFSEMAVGKYEVQVVLQDSKMAIVENKIKVEIVKPVKEVFSGVVIEVVPEIKEEEPEVEEVSNNDDGVVYPKVMAKITSISPFGDVMIKFSEDMVSNDFSTIDDKVLQLEIIPFEIPEGFDESKLAFTWKTVSFEGNELQLKLKFENPVYISLNLVQDILVIRFLQPKIFISQQTLQAIDAKYHRISSSIKKQIPDTDATKNFESASESADKVLKISFWATLIMNFLMSGSQSMDYFLAMLNSLQLIIHLPMLWIIMPGNVTMFFRLILPIVMFDVLNGLDDTPYDPNNFIEYDEEENELDKNKFISQMSDLGYNTHNAILNLGSLFILLVIYFIRMIVLVFLFIIQFLTGKCKEIYQKQKRMVFYNEIMLILVEGYMEFIISGYLNFQKPLFESGYLGEQISIIVSWFSIIGALIIAPLGFCHMIYQNQNTLETDEFKESFGSLYEGIKTDTRSTRAYFLFFILRRLIFCLASFFLTWSSAIQLQAVLILNIGMSIYTCYFRAKEVRVFNRLEIFAEFLINATTTHLMIFTDYVADPDLQYLAGYSMIGVICVLMGGHMAFVIWYGVKTVMLVVQKYWNLAKYKVCGAPQRVKIDVQETPSQTVAQEPVRIKPSILDKYVKLQNLQQLSKIIEEIESRPETPRVPQIEVTVRQAVFERLTKDDIEDNVEIGLELEQNVENTPIIAKTKKITEIKLPRFGQIEEYQPTPVIQKTQKSDPQTLKELHDINLDLQIEKILGNFNEDELQMKDPFGIDAAINQGLEDIDAAFNPEIIDWIPDQIPEN